MNFGLTGCRRRPIVTKGRRIRRRRPRSMGRLRLHGILSSSDPSLDGRRRIDHVGQFFRVGGPLKRREAARSSGAVSSWSIPRGTSARGAYGRRCVSAMPLRFPMEGTSTAGREEEGPAAEPQSRRGQYLSRCLCLFGKHGSRNFRNGCENLRSEQHRRPDSEALQNCWLQTPTSLSWIAGCRITGHPAGVHTRPQSGGLSTP